MQPQDSLPAGSGRNRLSQQFTKSTNGEQTGFSHGAFGSNQPAVSGYADRHPQRTNIPSLNTGRILQNQQNHDMQTPGTALDMNFTPLLPSQLLLGSPFQPGSPSAFASPHFHNFSGLPNQQPVNQHQTHQTHMSAALQGQQTAVSPQLYHGLASPTGVNGMSFYGGPQSPTAGYSSLVNQSIGGISAAVQMSPGLLSGTSRTVYLGNIPPETSAEEILSHVRSGQIESVRLLADKNCAFISFLDGSSATHFHSDAILKKLSIRGQDIKIGWGKPSQVPTSVALAVQQSGASRNVYLGNLPEEITEAELREDLGKFGPIDTVKIVREKSIGFVHFLSIGNAIKAVTQLPQEPKWQPPRRVYYGKDRCAYVSKTQQQNAAQYLGIAPGYAHTLNGADRDLISNALAQQSVAAAAVATSAGGVNNLGNRTVYLGNIHPETTIEEICNVVRGGLLHHIRYIPDKHICFVTFIDPTSAASFYALSNLQGLMIHNRRLKIGWGKHSGALPPAIALAVSGGASRNVYIGNLDESWSEDRLRQDFSEYGEIELVNALREKSCAFVNFTNIANAIKAIEAVRGREEYKRFKVNFGKDRCGNPPRQLNNGGTSLHHNQAGLSQDSLISPSPVNGIQPNRSQTGSTVSPTRSSLAPLTPSGPPGHLQHLQASNASAILNAGAANPLMLYLQQTQNQQQTNGADQVIPLHQEHEQQQQQPPPPQAFPLQQATFHGGESSNQSQQHYHPSHNPSRSFNMANGISVSPTPPTIGGLLAPSNLQARTQHARAVSLPVFSQGPFSQPQQIAHAASQAPQPQANFGSLSSGLGGFGSGSGYGLTMQSESTLPGWAEEEFGAQ